jgi:hypothetical protein
MAAGLATLALTAAAAADNPAQRGEAASAQVVPPALSPEEEARAEAAVAAREREVGRRFDPAFREALKRAPNARLEPGDSGADLVFTPVTPCRVLDTRASSGPIPATGQLPIRVAGALTGQGGAPNCGVPLGPATAAVLNFVAVAPQGPGDLRAWAFGGGVPTASVLNYQAVPGLNIANGVVVPLCDSGAGSCPADVVLQADVSGTQVVVDVMGYFRSLRPPVFLGANWLFQTVPPVGSGANQLSSVTFTATLNAIARLRARGYCNVLGLAGSNNEVHLAIGANASEAYDTTVNPVSNWGIMMVPAGSPLSRHVAGFSAERFVAVAAGATYTYRVFGRHQAGSNTDDCSGTFFVETSF